MRDRCYTINTPEGEEFRIYAGKKPDPKTIMALQALLKAAVKFLKDSK